MGAKKLTNQEKAAVVLLAMGEELAGNIVGQMSSDEARRIGLALSRLGRVEQTVVDEVLAEFGDALSSGQPAGLSGGADHARRLFAKALPADALAGLADALDLATPMLAETLAHIDIKVLAQYLRREHPQTVALVLAHTPSATAGQVLKMLPDGMHVDLIQRLATLGPVLPEVLEDILVSLQAEQTSAKLVQQSPGGVMKVVGLLNGLSGEAAAALLADLERRDPALAAQVRQKLFTFADLVRVPARGMQFLLAQVPQETLRLALKDAAPQVAAHIFANMSQRAATSLREDLEAMPKRRKAEVEAAQQQLAELAQRLADEGKIELPSKDDQYV